jgi:predicted Zn-dependent peptidase
MALVVAGDVDAEEIYKTAENIVRKKQSHEIERVYGEEPKQIKQSYTEQKMSIALPLFNIGFKDDDYGTETEKRTAETKVLLDIIAGESGELYAELYREGLIDQNFDMNYMNSPYFGTSILGGYSKSPEKVRESLIKEIRRLKTEGIKDELFERIKKKHIGRLIKGFNSLNAIVYGQTEYFTKNTDIIEIFKGYYNLKKDDIIDRLHKHFDEETMAMSVVK